MRDFAARLSGHLVRDRMCTVVFAAGKDADASSFTRTGRRALRRDSGHRLAHAAAEIRLMPRARMGVRRNAVRRSRSESS